MQSAITRFITSAPAPTTMRSATAHCYGDAEGSNNIGVGLYALEHSDGSNNIAIGSYAGANLTNGGSNIDVGSRGVAGESAVIRIGDASAQLAVYVAGISNSKVTGSAV